MDKKAFVVKTLPSVQPDSHSWAPKRPPVNAIDRLDGGVYGRTLVLAGRPIEVRIVLQGASFSDLLLKVTAMSDRLSEDMIASVGGLIVDILGLRVDVTDFYAMASRYPDLASLVERLRGLKPLKVSHRLRGTRQRNFVPATQPQRRFAPLVKTGREVWTRIGP